MKRLVLLGSTGSIGEQTLSVVADFPERFRVTALAAGRNVARLAEQVRRFRPERVAVALGKRADVVTFGYGRDADERMLRAIASTPDHYYYCSDGDQLVTRMTTAATSVTLSFRARESATASLSRL